MRHEKVRGRRSRSHRAEACCRAAEALGVAALLSAFGCRCDFWIFKFIFKNILLFLDVSININKVFIIVVRFSKFLPIFFKFSQSFLRFSIGKLSVLSVSVSVQYLSR